MTLRLFPDRPAVTLAVAIVLGMVLAPSVARAGPTWVAECYQGHSCTAVEELVTKIQGFATTVGDWYTEGNLPVPDVEVDGATGALIVRVDPSMRSCGARALGCYKRYPDLNEPRRLVVSVERRKFGGETNEATGEESPVVEEEDSVIPMSAEVVVAHEMLHAIQYAAMGPSMFEIGPSKNMLKALHLAPAGDSKGMIWLFEGTAVAMEEEWIERTGNKFFLNDPGYIPDVDLDASLISPDASLGDPYRLGPFLHYLGKAYPGGMRGMVKDMFVPALMDGADGLIHVDRIMRNSTGNGLRTHFARFVAQRGMPLNASEKREKQDYSYGIKKEDFRLDEPTTQTLAMHILAYAAQAHIINVSPKPLKAPYLPEDIQILDVVKLEPAGDAAHPDLLLVVDKEILPEFSYRRLYAQGDTKDRWFVRVVNFADDPLGAKEQRINLQLSTQPLHVSPPTCVMPGRQAYVYVNQPTLRLSWKVEAGKLVSSDVGGFGSDGPSDMEVAGRLLYTAPDRAGRYAITLPTGPNARRVKVGEITVSPDPCRADLVWENDETTRSRYVFPLPNEAIGRPTSKEFGGAEIIIRGEETVVRKGPLLNAGDAKVKNAEFSAILERDLAILSGAIPPEVAAEIAALPEAERAMTRAAMENLRAVTGFESRDQIATFDSPTRSFDMLNPFQAMDGAAEMIFRMMRLDRLPKDAELRRAGAPAIVRRSGQPCLRDPEAFCTVVITDGVTLTYSPNGLLTRTESDAGRVDIYHNPEPRVRETLLLLTLMDRLPWEG